MNRSDHSKEHKYNTINNKIIWIYKMYENQSIIYLFDHQLVFFFFVHPQTNNKRFDARVIFNYKPE
jgi:hypothetical protein